MTSRFRYRLLGNFLNNTRGPVINPGGISAPDSPRDFIFYYSTLCRKRNSSDRRQCLKKTYRSAKGGGRLVNVAPKQSRHNSASFLQNKFYIQQPQFSLYFTALMEFYSPCLHLSWWLGFLGKKGLSSSRGYL